MALYNIFISNIPLYMGFNDVTRILRETLQCKILGLFKNEEQVELPFLRQFQTIISLSIIMLPTRVANL